MIPERKINFEKSKVRQNCECKLSQKCQKCKNKENLIDKMAKAGIPLDYWFRNMENFYGNEDFGGFVKDYINNLDENYNIGISHYFFGNRGCGKTMASCSILKKALIKEYSGIYITIVDMVSLFKESPEWRTKLKNFDFLVIDEVDRRFFNSENSKDFFGNQLEHILRGRFSNKLPTIICSNESSIYDIFTGEIEISLKSLGSQFIKSISAQSRDSRQGKEKI